MGELLDFIFIYPQIHEICMSLSHRLGLAMNQIELEKIADSFDKDRSGTIDLREIVSVLKGGSRQTRRPVVQETLTDQQKIDNEVSCKAMMSHNFTLCNASSLYYSVCVWCVYGVWCVCGVCVWCVCGVCVWCVCTR